MAVVSSILVFQRLRLKSSTCIRPQNDSTIALSYALPTARIDGGPSQRLGRHDLLTAGINDVVVDLGDRRAGVGWQREPSKGSFFGPNPRESQRHRGRLFRVSRGDRRPCARPGIDLTLTSPCPRACPSAFFGRF